MEKNICVHCGQECGKHPIMWDNKPFCCEGCKTVFQILQNNKLYKYYEIENNPGIKIISNDYGNKYAYLDDEEIKHKLYDFSEGNIKKIKLFIPSIHCSSCIWLLENLYTLNKGISQSLVNFVRKEVTIVFNDNEISLRQIVELLASIHYIPQITLESVDKSKNQKINKTLLYKIGISGFAFGNTMLFSFPEYVPGSEFIDFHYKTFFGYMNLLLALPVFLYCGNDYLISAFKSIRKKIMNIDIPIAIGLIAIFFESTYQILSGSGSGYMDSLSGLVFFLLIGKWYQSKTYQALTFDRDYKSYFPIAVTKIENNIERSVQIKDLAEGDLIIIRNHELIPADAELVNGKANIDYSFVTGESIPVSKNKGDLIYAGGKQIGSVIELKVKTKVEQSKLTQIWNQNKDSNDQNYKGLGLVIDKIGQNFTIAVLAISFLTAIFWFFTDNSMVIKTFTSVLIVACPCALALSIPFAYSNTMRIFGNSGLYLKKNEIVERLSKVDTIVFDKTGTITMSDIHDIDFKGKKLTNDEKNCILSVTRHSTHPLSISITKFLISEISSDNILDISEFEEIEGQGIKAEINGNLYKIGSGQFIGYQVTATEIFDTKVHVSVNNNYLGYFAMQNKYRKGIENVLAELKSKKYEIHLISGDNITEKQRLELHFKDNLHFNQSPTDKLNYINNLKAENKNVLMIGDGLNDAGALNAANVGLTIADDIYHFSPACDGILESSKFEYLAKFIQVNKKSIKIVKISFILSFIYNIVGLSFAVQGLLSPIIAAILMPLSSISVVAFVTILTSITVKKNLKIEI